MHPKCWGHICLQSIVPGRDSLSCTYAISCSAVRAWLYTKPRAPIQPGNTSENAEGPRTLHGIAAFVQAMTQSNAYHFFIALLCEACIITVQNQWFMILPIKSWMFAVPFWVSSNVVPPSFQILHFPKLSRPTPLTSKGRHEIMRKHHRHFPDAAIWIGWLNMIISTPASPQLLHPTLICRMEPGYRWWEPEQIELEMPNHIFTILRIAPSNQFFGECLAQCWTYAAQLCHIVGCGGPSHSSVCHQQFASPGANWELII